MVKQRSYTLSNINKIISKNIITIIIVTILGAAAGGIYAKHKKVTIYSAKSSVMVKANLNNVDYKNSAVLAEKGMMKTYEEIAGNQESMTTARKYLSKKLRNELNAEDMVSAINVDSSPDSLILNFNAKTKSDKDSIAIANAVAKAAVVELPKYSQTKSSVTILTKANTKNVTSSTTPSVKKHIVMGAALGLLVGMVISFSVTTWKHM